MHNTQPFHCLFYTITVSILVDSNGDIIDEIQQNVTGNKPCSVISALFKLITGK